MDTKATGHLCTECGAKLVIRTNRNTNTDFMGCERYPVCRFTMPLAADIEMRRAGAEALPGFD